MCSIDDCDGRVFARGWCRVHWNRWRRYGDPLDRRQIQRDDLARLGQHFIQFGDDDCWPWTAQRNANGYGRAFLRGHKTYAHRAVYEVLVGPIPEGLDLDHACHNADPTCSGGPTCPHRSCVNPAHLRPETPKVNRGQSNARRMSASSA